MDAKNYPKLGALVGKTVSKVHMSDSHGDVLQISFTDGTTLDVADYYGTEIPRRPAPDELYVAINYEEL